MMNILQRINRQIGRLFRFAMVFLALLLTAVMAVEVVFRYLLDTAFPAI